jgi:dTDP-4-dehydrorhamnose 3,5-epimerase
VIIDLRPKSKTFKKWLGITLDSHNKIIYIPKGFAHGFQTLQNNTLVNYQISEFLMPEYSRGIKWNDSNFQIKWPLKPTIISKKDQSYQQFRY